MKYHQFFAGDFDSQELAYIKFDTAHFNVYVYFEKGYYPNIVHFYSHKEMEAHGKASPVVENYPTHKIPVHELEEMSNSRYETASQAREWLKRVDEKLHLIAVFS